MKPDANRQTAVGRISDADFALSPAQLNKNAQASFPRRRESSN
jgi:hypothetical protein